MTELGWYALSFAGEEGWLGGCYVEAQGPGHAVLVSIRHGCNPGGEVAILGPLPLDDFEENVPAEWRYVLLGRTAFAGDDAIELEL